MQHALRGWLLAFSLFIPGLLPAARAQAPAWLWAEPLGYSQSTRIVSGPAGDLFVVDDFTDSLTLGSLHLMAPAPGISHFVARRTPAGAYAWSTTLAENVEVSYLTVDAQNNTYLTGRIIFYDPSVTIGPFTVRSGVGTVKFYVAKLTPTGAWAWLTTSSSLTDGSSAWPRGITVDSRGRIAVAGIFNADTLKLGTITLPPTVPGGNTGRLFVAGLSPSGAWQWAIQPGGSGVVITSSLTGDSTGRLTLAGSYADTLILGATTLTDHYGGYVARVSPTGSWQWATTVPNTGASYLDATMVAASTGEVVLVSPFAGSWTFGNTTLTPWPNNAFDVVVARLDAAGQWQWAQKLGGDADELVSGIALAPNGDVVLGGSFNSSSLQVGTTTLVNASDSTFIGGSGGPSIGFLMMDGFVARLDQQGAWQWAVGLNGRNNEVATTVAVDPQGVVWAGGFFDSDTLLLGPMALPQAIPDRPQGFLAQLGTPTGLAADGAGTPFTLHPNPAHHTVQITNAPAPTAEIVDALGRTVRTIGTSPLAPQTSNLLGLPAGLYVVRCGGASRRLVVE